MANHRIDRLAVSHARFIKAALTRNNEVGFFQELIKFVNSKHCLRALDYLCAEQGCEHCSDAAGSAAAGDGAYIPSCKGIKELFKILHAAFEHAELILTCALLRSKGICGSFFARHGITYIAEQLYIGIFELFAYELGIYSYDPFRIRTAAQKDIPFRVEESDAERGCRAHAAVISCGAAQTENDMLCAA